MAKKAKKRIHQSAAEPLEAEVVEVDERRAEAAPAANNPALRNVIIIAAVVIGLFFLLNSILHRSGNNEKTAGDETSQNKEGDNSKSTDKKDDAAPAPTVLPDGTTVSETDKAFTYTVGEGESYTTVARRAIAATDSKLTAAERVAAETKLTTDAGAELLAVGQSVELSKDAVRAAIQWAKNLSGEEKAAWQPYADLVAW